MCNHIQAERLSTSAVSDIVRAAVNVRGAPRRQTFMTRLTFRRRTFHWRVCDNAKAKKDVNASSPSPASVTLRFDFLPKNFDWPTKKN